MRSDPLSGVEIELVLASMTRIELASILAYSLKARADGEMTISKVPVPQLKGRVPDTEVAAATIAAMQANAAMHAAQIARVSADGQHYFMEHRAARLSDDDGLVCRLLHDNTLEGGERVCEIVTPPLRGDGLRARLGRVLEALRRVALYTFTDTTALHVHIEHAAIDTPTQLARLIDLYAKEEQSLRSRLRTPRGLQRAKPLPRAVVDWRPGSDNWTTARSELAQHIIDRDCGLNLYNLVADVQDKPTVELKIAGSTDDIDTVMETRAVFVDLIARSR